MPDHDHAWARKAAEEINALLKAGIIESIRVWAKENEDEIDGFEMAIEVEGTNVDCLAAIILRHVGPILAEKDARIAALERRLDPKRDTRGQEPVRWVADGEIEFRQEYSKEATP